MPLNHLRNRIFRVLLLLMFTVISTVAQTQTVKILGIDVVGNTYVDAATILAIAGIQAGEEVSSSSDKIQQAVKNLWRRKQFSDVNILVDKTTPLGVFLKITVKEFPRLGEITAKGLDKLDLKEIRKAVGKFRGDIISNYDAYLAKKAVLKLYEKEGMPFAKVEAQIIPDSLSYAKLALTIEEGSNFYVKNIEFVGNSLVSSSALAGSFEDTHTKEWWQFWRTTKFEKEKYDKDKKSLLTFYKKKGFIDAEILRDSLYYDAKAEEIGIKVWVYEGNKFYVRNLTFEGNSVYPSEILQRRLNFQTGDVYDLERFERNLYQNEEQNDLASLYMNNGYLTASFDKEEKRVGQDSVDIIIRVTERNQFTIRKVEIVGNSKTLDKVIRRELFTRPGDFFNRSAVINSIRALGVLNYFNPEALQPKIQPVDNTRVDVTYKVEEKSSDTFNASVGFAGTFGLTGSVGITLNNFFLKEPLQGGGGQVFNFNWEFGASSRYQTFSLGFTEPWLFDQPTTVGFNLFDSRYQVGYDLRQTGLSINVGRRFRWPDDFFRGDWMMRFKRNQLTGDQALTGFRPGVSTELTLSQTFSRISLDNAIFPTEGSRFSLSTQFAPGAFGLGTTDYLKNSYNMELYTPLLQIGGFNRLVLYLGSQGGYVTGIKSDTTIPPIEVYFMGGNGLGGFSVTPLRGYPDRSLGPTDSRGNLIGGQLMMRHLAELRFALSMNPVPIYLISFLEAGNIWSNLKSSDPFDLKRSAGVGMRIMLNPIGLLGFDYGYGFDPVGNNGTTKSGWQFHFQFGR